MKILLTGPGGQLGSELARRLSDDHDVVGLSRDSSSPFCEVIGCDITETSKVYETVTRVNPDLVINTAAQSNVDECEHYKLAAYRVNALGPRNLAVACQRFDSALLHVSTDYVFGGRERGVTDGYSEYDDTCPVNYYGISKLMGERYVTQHLDRFFIVRTSWLFGHKRDNFVSQTAKALIRGEQVKMVSDMVSSPTNVKDLSLAISSLVESRKYGTYNLSNSGFASRYDIAMFIAEKLSADGGLVKRASLKELSLKAARPSFSGMKNFVWQAEGYTPLRSWQDSVCEYLSEMSI